MSHANDLPAAINVIRSMVPIIDPTEDYLSIVAAENQMTAVAKSRQQDCDEMNAKLRDQLAKLETARAACTRPPNELTPEAHLEALNALETAQRNLMKGINMAEGSLAEKESTVSRLKKERATLEMSDPAVEHELDASTLKLTLIKELGFTPIKDKTSGDYKIIVRSQSREIHSVPFERNKQPEETANHLWQLASS